MADASSSSPLVIDNGSGCIKAGFAGGDLPEVVMSSFVGRAKHDRIMAGAGDDESFIGRRADELKGVLRLSYPMSHGAVTDWDDMERIWSHIYTKELSLAPEEHAVLLTESPLNPRRNRERAAELMFERFNAPALFVSSQAVLSLYASGRTSGVVLDAGDTVSYAMPIYEGFALSHAITRADYGGRDVTSYLRLLLRREGHVFDTSSGLERVRGIKESVCEVSQQIALDSSIGGSRAYTLPDGSVLDLGQARCQAPELLFDPSLIGLESPGVTGMLHESLMKCDLDVRRHLMKQVVLSGGSTLFPGFGDRLLSETRKLVGPNTKVRISAPPERKYSTWIGGSILASLASFKKMW
eukprot:CAMPEP_0173455526 /NCGR_PEP_ID=MMETSP1357-20121228/54419_1 /TAXON_ID=77926 /ORGANISM="Hemiselmis rufescens, Strain PCC563" /LENGTH=353 /DNA_ID=CAMNT_0014422667 /DNA_START=13 /DNA_END=1071 /DNA_ORIENTATION=+